MNLQVEIKTLKNKELFISKFVKVKHHLFVAILKTNQK